MSKRKNIMNWNVAGIGDAKGRDMISAGGTGI